MAGLHTILYGVLGALGGIAIIVIIVASCLICREKREKQNKKRSKFEALEKAHPKKEKKQKPRATHPRTIPQTTTTTTRPERIQPTTDSEMGRTPRVPVESRRAHSSASRHKRNTTASKGGYRPLDDTTSQDDSEMETESKSGRSSVNRDSLLAIPFGIRSGRHSARSGSVSPLEEAKQKSHSQPELSVAIPEKLGSLFVNLHYDFQDSSLVLKIVRAKQLAAKDLGGTSDPYVRIKLLPDKKHKLETKVKRKSLNPVWNETFLFERFPYDKLKSRTIHLEVLDKDRFTSDDPIREFFLPLVDMNLAERCADDEMELKLKPVDEDQYRLGEILLALGYDSNRQKKERKKLVV